MSIKISGSELASLRRNVVFKKFLKILAKEKLELAETIIDTGVPEKQIDMYRGQAILINSIIAGDFFDNYLKEEE